MLVYVFFGVFAVNRRAEFTEQIGIRYVADVSAVRAVRTGKSNKVRIASRIQRALVGIPHIVKKSAALDKTGQILKGIDECLNGR